MRKLKRINRIKEKKLIKKEKIPQIRAIVTSIETMSPKKPNSAIRKVIKAKTRKGIITAYIPGEKNNITIQNEVLIRKGKVQDLVSVNYKVIRGTLDVKGPERTKSRSKYGVRLIQKGICRSL